jgi:pSer/pThr/pTyr-binding forkhead associated (FHA) protein
VIVNTGTDVILKDLRTKCGTMVNKERVNISLLQDGDVLVIGSNRIQVAIQVPRDAVGDSGAGLQYDDPTVMPTAVSIGLVHTEQDWTIRDAVVLVGRHELAGVRLDHEQVSRRHAVIFRYGVGPAVFDLGGENGLMINARITPQSPLYDGDRITIGPFGLEVRAPKAKKSGGASDTASPVEIAATRSLPPMPTAPAVSVTSAPTIAKETGPKDAVSLDAGLDGLQKEINESWKRLNDWEAKLLNDANALNQQETDLSQRVKELESRDAALRGQFHDMTRLQEMLAAQEKEFLRQKKQLDAERQEFEMSKQACLQRDSDIARRTQELSRREHVFAQRWSRLHGMKCQKCGHAVTINEPDEA